jgi:hypothetical protein
VIRQLAILALALFVFAGNLTAQGSRRRQDSASVSAPRRQQLEARLRQGLWRITKNRVGLSDDQMAKLAEAIRPFDAQRRQLAMQEREERLTLRREILAGPDANQSRVSASLDRVLDVQRRRVQLQIDEQRSLAAFMTPVQRAKYAALQEQLRRRAENLRQRRTEDLLPRRGGPTTDTGARSPR